MRDLVRLIMLEPLFESTLWNVVETCRDLVGVVQAVRKKERGVPLLDSTRLRGVFHMRAFSLIFKETEEHNSTTLGTTT